MPRKPRIDFPGAWHHVMHRGARRAPIFHTDRDVLRFLRLLDEMVSRFSIEVHAYALMPNHYHLLLRSVHGNLSSSMRHLNASYTQKTNHVHDWDGPLFRGRFHSQLLRTPGRLPYVLAYIHLNPLRARLVTRLTSECWTSHLAYLGRESAPEWLTQHFFLNLFGRRKALHEYVHNLHRGRLQWPDEMSLDTGFVLEPADKEETHGSTAAGKWSADAGEVLDLVCKTTGASLATLRRIEYGPRANPPRRFAAWALVRRAGLTQRETGEVLGMSTQQVANVLRRWPDEDEALAVWREAYENLQASDK